MLVIPILHVIQDYEYTNCSVIQPSAELLKLEKLNDEIIIGCVQQPKWN